MAALKYHLKSTCLCYKAGHYFFLPFLLILYLSFIPNSAYSQRFDNENFGNDIQYSNAIPKRRRNTNKTGRAKGLWVDRTTTRPSTPHSLAPQPNSHTNRTGYKQPSYGASSNASKEVQSQDLAPLSGTQSDNSAPYNNNQGRNNIQSRGQAQQQRPTQPQFAPNNASPNNANNAPANNYGAGKSRFSQSDVITFNGLTPLTGDIWQDISIGQLAKVAPHLKLPLRSYTYQDLLAQLLLSEKSKPSGHQRTPLTFQAIRLKVLYRAGLIGVLRSYLKNIPLQERSPLSKLYSIKTGFALGHKKSYLCEDLAEIPADNNSLPKENFGTLILLKSYCLALTGKIESAQLSTNIAREQGIAAPIPFAVIDFLAGIGKPNFSLPKQLSLRDYLFLSLAGGKAPPNLVQIAEPALLHYLSSNKKVAEEQRALAAEQFSKIDLLDSKRLAHTYQNMTKRGYQGSALRRANIYQSIILEQDPNRKARKIQMLLQAAKKHNIAFPIAAILHPELKKIAIQKNMDWFAASATEIAMLARDTQLAMRWITISPRTKAGQKGAVANLFVLLEISDSQSGLPKKAGLLAATDLAKANYLSPVVLHRLVTVLEALSYNIPIPLWEAASRTPQPQQGYLPPSGALSALKSAAKVKAPARTILMAIEATGKDGPQGVHLIGLRDIIQNLTKAGYEKAARRLGFEALYTIWP